MELVANWLSRKFSFEALWGLLSPWDAECGERRVTLAVRCTGAQLPPALLLMGVRWDVASPIRPRHVDALLLTRGVHVEHSTIHRWVVTDRQQREEALHRRQRPGWPSWRRDETDPSDAGPTPVSSFHLITRACRYG